MPTASDYRAEITNLDALSESLSRVWSAMEDRRVDTGLAGGPVATSVDTALGASIANTSLLAGRCEAVREECVRRAALCDQFTEDMRAHRARHAIWLEARLRFFEAESEGRPVVWPGAEPTPPAPPFPGAEAE